jgi:hypothetical protein
MAGSAEEGISSNSFLARRVRHLLLIGSVALLPALVGAAARAGDSLLAPPGPHGTEAMSTESRPPASAPAPAPDVAGKNPLLSGQLSTKFGIDDSNPEASVPGNKERDRNPLEFGYFLQDLLERANQAQKDKDYGAVVRYYRAVAKAVPDNSKGWSKLCEAYERVNDRERAIRSCRYAIDRPGVELQDYVRYVHLVLAEEGPLSGPAKKELDAVLGHLEEQDGTAIAVAVGHLRCEMGLKAKDIALMGACTKSLANLAPDDPKTVVFQWSLAVMKGQGAEAQHLLERARATGVMHDSIERMESVTPAMGGPAWRKAAIAAATLLLMIVAAAALVIAVRRRRALSDRAA